MAIADADPRAAELDAAFAQAMTGPARPRVEAKPPPELDHDAPHGRDENGVPLAPYGWTKPQRKGEEPRPKLTASGRRLKDSTDQPRTMTAEEAAAQPAATGNGEWKPSGENYMADLSSFADAVWFGMSVLGAAGSSLPLIGKLIPEEKIAAQAHVLAETKPRLVAAVSLAAQHNAKAEAFCEKLKGGDGFWALQCMFMVMPVVSLSAAVWQGDKALAELDDSVSLASLAAKNKERMDEFMAQLAAQMEAATQNAMAVPGEVVNDAGSL